MTPHDSVLIAPGAHAVAARTAGTAASSDLWRRDHYLAPAVDLLPRIEVLSLDVFDALLFRVCARPEDVFLQVTGRTFT